MSFFSFLLRHNHCSLSFSSDSDQLLDEHLTSVSLKDKKLIAHSSSFCQGVLSDCIQMLQNAFPALCGVITIGMLTWSDPRVACTFIVLPFEK